MNFFKKLTRTFVDVFLAPAKKSAKKKKTKSSTRKRIKPSKKKISKPANAAKKTQPKGIKSPSLRAVKTPSAKSSPKILKKNHKRRTSAKPTKPDKPVKLAEPEGKLIGQVTHFFPQVKAAALKITAASGLQVGETLFFKGATTHFKLKITSMQINRIPVTQAAKGAEVGILVPKRVREGDEVYKL